MGTGMVRIEGGFVGVDARELAHAWRACLGGPPGIGGFRAWLAAHEMVARRQGLGGRRTPRYGVAELAALLGVSARTAAASIRRLVSAGLLSWSGSEIGFPAASRIDGPGEGLADTIGRGDGPVAIPRRLLRWLARGARPAIIATALASLLRCLSRRRTGWTSRGRFKSSWVAAAFGVAERHARAARAELVRLGWLRPEEEARGQWAWNRWGKAFRVALDWRPPRADRPTPSHDPVTRSSYPDQTPIPCREENHPDPAGPGPAGASPGREDGEVPAPDLRDIRSEDLADTSRALELHRQAVARGVVTSSEADRVRFVAAVEHARAVGRANPPGLLARIVSKRWWHLLTQADEDRAARRLREHRRPNIPAPTPRSAPVSPPAFRSPYGQGQPAREPSALGDLLARLAFGAGS